MKKVNRPADNADPLAVEVRSMTNASGFLLEPSVGFVVASLFFQTIDHYSTAIPGRSPDRERAASVFVAGCVTDLMTKGTYESVFFSSGLGAKTTKPAARVTKAA